MLYTSKWIIALGVSLFAATPEAIITLVVLMFIDYVTGLLAAWYVHQLDYQKGLKGLIKKAQTLIVVCTMYYGETRVPKLSQFGLASIFAGMFCVNELISIIENASNSGADIPPGLVSTLQRFKRIQNLDFSRPIIPEPPKIADPKA